MNSADAVKRQLTVRAIPWTLILIALVILFVFATFWIYGQLSFWAVLILLAALAALAFFGEYVSITLDRDRRTASFDRIRVWRKTQRQIPFDDFHTISVEETRVQSSTEATTSVFRILFVLKSGESFRQTNISNSRRAAMVKTVQKMVDFINQGHLQVKAALDGIVRLARDGSTDGTSWQVEFVANNDRPILTRWKTERGQFMGGFLLIIPNVGGMKMQAPGGKMPQSGWANMAFNYVYTKFLDTMDLKTSDLPGFSDMQVLKGSQVGLSDQFNVLSNNLAEVQNWLTPEKKQRIMNWTQTNPLKAKKGEGAPNLLATPHGFILFFRGNYPAAQQLELITQLGMVLIR